VRSKARRNQLKLIARTIKPTSSLFVWPKGHPPTPRGTWRNSGEKMFVHNVRLNWVDRESRDLSRRCGCLFIYFCRRIARSSLR